jgi:murein DD-endopeptidase MepM/ murein hydrolase activator NlpD
MVSHYPLAAVASGTVSGVGSDGKHGIYQTIRYGKYEVTYAHLANVYANFGEPVVAGQTVSLSSERIAYRGALSMARN